MSSHVRMRPLPSASQGARATPARAPGLRAGPASEARGRSWRARDPLRRRMLAGADLGTAVLGGATLGLAGAGAGAAVGGVAFAPAWLLAAKLFGLYDRDHRSLRHLTVDELSLIAVWVIACVAALVLFLTATSIAAVG